MQYCKLNPEFKTRLVTTLKTGTDPVTGKTYKKGRFVLRSCNGEDQFCCLGVAMDMLDPTWMEGGDPSAWGGPKTIGDAQGSNAADEEQSRKISRHTSGVKYLPETEDFISKTGMDRATMNQLAVLNDGTQLTYIDPETGGDRPLDGPQSFEKIGEFIEKYL